METNLAQIDNESNRIKKLKLKKELTFEEFYKDVFKDNKNSRSEFSKDKDRILFSRAFRRLVHKAQVYSPAKGDHFRTRLTHSLEVAQISKSLAHYLNLNENLAEAIALGHDIGHTPFGHQGERVLDEILKGDETLNGKIKFPLNFGGFKHNYNSIKILDENEFKFSSDYIYPKIENPNGLDLSWQVLEGIIKHTKIKRHEKKEERKCENGQDCQECWNINRFTNNEELKTKLHLKYDNSVTLEGQIVAIADEIAQRQHDLDDGLRDSDLKLDVKDLLGKLINWIGSEAPLETDKLITKLNQQLEELKKSDDNLFITTTLIRNIIEYFIIDVTLNSKLNLSNVEENEKDEKIFKKEYIQFSKFGKKLNEYVETLINTKIINSYDANRYDGKAIFIIKQLFKAYYTNPRQMKKYVLDRLAKNIKKNIEELHSKYSLSIIKNINFNIFEENEKEFINLLKVSSLNIETIRKNSIYKEMKNHPQVKEVFNKSYFHFIDYLLVDFQNDKPYKINTVIKLLKLDEDELEKFSLKLDNTEVSQKKYQNILNTSWINTEKENIIYKFILECHYSYIEAISNYIAGMTDNYATKEFEELY